MQPDSMESRVGRLEQTVAGMRQKLEDQSSDIKSLMPLAVAFGRFELVVERLQGDQRDTLQLVRDNHRETRQMVREVMERMDEDAQNRMVGQRERKKEDRGRKLTLVVAFIAAASALLSAMVTAAAVLLG
jgi:hypothetical protein